MDVSFDLDWSILEIRLRNWADCLVRVHAMQPQGDVVILGLQVTAAVATVWGVVHLVRRRFR